MDGGGSGAELEDTPATADADAAAAGVTHIGELTPEVQKQSPESNTGQDAMQYEAEPDAEIDVGRESDPDVETNPATADSNDGAKEGL